MILRTETGQRPDDLTGYKPSHADMVRVPGGTAAVGSERVENPGTVPLVNPFSFNELCLGSGLPLSHTSLVRDQRQEQIMSAASNSASLQAPIPASRSGVMLDV